MYNHFFIKANNAAYEHLNKGSIVAMADSPYSEGTYPSAWIVVCNDEGIMGNVQRKTASIHRVIFPDNRDPYFDNGTYNLSYPRAMEIWNQKVAREVMAYAS